MDQIKRIETGPFSTSRLGLEALGGTQQRDEEREQLKADPVTSERTISEFKLILSRQ